MKRAPLSSAAFPETFSSHETRGFLAGTEVGSAESQKGGIEAFRASLLPCEVPRNQVYDIHVRIIAVIITRNRQVSFSTRRYEGLVDRCRRSSHMKNSTANERVVPETVGIS